MIPAVSRELVASVRLAREYGRAVRFYRRMRDVNPFRSAEYRREATKAHEAAAWWLAHARYLKERYGR